MLSYIGLNSVLSGIFWSLYRSANGVLLNKNPGLLKACIPFEDYFLKNNGSMPGSMGDVKG